MKTPRITFMFLCLIVFSGILLMGAIYSIPIGEEAKRRSLELSIKACLNRMTIQQRLQLSNKFLGSSLTKRQLDVKDSNDLLLGLEKTCELDSPNRVKPLTLHIQKIDENKLLVTISKTQN